MQTFLEKICEMKLDVSPNISIDEIASYCDSVEDFDELFREYLRLQGEESNVSISKLIIEEYKRQCEGKTLLFEVSDEYQNKKEKYIN